MKGSEVEAAVATAKTKGEDSPLLDMQLTPRTAPCLRRIKIRFARFIIPVHLVVWIRGSKYRMSVLPSFFVSLFLSFEIGAYVVRVLCVYVIWQAP